MICERASFVGRNIRHNITSWMSSEGNVYVVLLRVRPSDPRKTAERSNFIIVGLSRTVLDPIYHSQVITLDIPDVWKGIL